MAIMGLPTAIKLQEGSLQSLAMLPQNELMRLAQSRPSLLKILPIVLEEKAQMAKDSANFQAQMQLAQQGQPKTITEQNVATIAQSEAQPQANMGIATAPMREDMYQEENYAGGGIVAFDGGGEVPRFQNRGYVDPTFSEMIRKRETGGYRGDPNFAVSPKGAMGIMQIMPATAMRPGFGVPDIFRLADELGVPYEDKSEESAKKLLTIPELNKSFGDLYAGAMLTRFEGNPQLAAAAYNAGPGAVERAGGVPNIAETQKYVAGISPERMEAASEKVRAARREQMGLAPLPEQASPAQPIPGATAAIDQITDITRRGVAEDRQQEFADYLSGRRPITPASPEMAKIAAQQRAAEKPTEAPVPTAPTESPFADFRKYLEGQEASLKSQRDEDKAMAILAAGLGILGGTSPYAFTNIGQGALQGVALSSKMAEQRAAKEKSLLAARLGLSEAEIRDKYYTGQLSAKEMSNRIAAGRLGATMQGNLIKARKQFMDEGGADRLAAEFEARHGKNWRKNPKLEGEYKLQMNELIKEIAGGMGMSGVRSARSYLGEEED